ncbi:MAG: transketolase [Elusimicrobia bacterium RIFOXYA2_FULL_58_8]|nr:MAG: transketolase [Elusimicrobia bacterium RIFOXYA2_FULL_58_8]OGS13779.1 MAG: transketolase [Elusimicrobia bacterium RIFOXYA12_FULL_57_11]
MRNAFAREITALAEKNEKIVLLSGDIGNKLFDDYKKKVRGRFFNCGVAEANMMSVAAGMAMCGLRPVTYTIASFSTTRCLEQIRIDIAYHNLPVIIVGVGGGLSYAENGASHQSCEDIAFLSALPNMKIICPGDAMEATLALRKALEQDSPVYLRLGKKGEPAVHQAPPDFAIGKAIIVSKGSEVCLLGVGNMLPTAAAAAKALKEHGITAEVVSLHTAKPLDEELLRAAFSRFSIVATIEEHSIMGGVGSAVAQWLAQAPDQKARLLEFATPDRFFHTAGRQQYARDCFGLTADNICGGILRALKPGKN